MAHLFAKSAKAPIRLTRLNIKFTLKNAQSASSLGNFTSCS